MTNYFKKSIKSGIKLIGFDPIPEFIPIPHDCDLCKEIHDKNMEDIAWADQQFTEHANKEIKRLKAVEEQR